ncbi:MAG: hypothetical protein U9O24_04320 [Campylobacterota bacterium]|nr:hypothetical protein [Campylobacterota bacterium]
MNLNNYKNELIVLFMLLLMISAIFYKNNQINVQGSNAVEVQNNIVAFKEIVSLKRVWGDKGLTKKVEKLQKLINVSKVKWSKKSKKVTAIYKGLTAEELNKLVTKILSLAVEIQKLEIQKKSSTYDVEFKCKW